MEQLQQQRHIGIVNLTEGFASKAKGDASCPHLSELSCSSPTDEEDSEIDAETLERQEFTCRVEDTENRGKPIEK